MRYLILSIIPILFLSGCDIYPKVEYYVGGSARAADITYANESEGTSQIANQRLPWWYVFEADYGQFVYVSAQNCSRTGTIRVTIYKDGEIFKESVSSGAYVIATASGLL